MKTSLFYLPSVGSRADIEAGMAGMRGDLYGNMLKEVSEQACLADALGYDSINFTEHHFHVEGIELSNNPVMLDLYIGMQTKRIRVGQLGIVLPADNPIRIAEDIAMLDHMTGGRANAGFARGYQRRWVDVMAQHTHGVHGALPNKHDEIDAANRAAFGGPNIRFEQADLSTHPAFPACDLILCKDVLQHLSNGRVSAILSKCVAARRALITNDYHPENSDCRDGETRPLDVRAPPFGFSSRPVLRFGRKVSFLWEHAAH